MKKIFLALSLFSTAFFLLNCKKNNEELLKPDSHVKTTETSLGTITQREATTSEKEQLESFMGTEYWGDFSSDNGDLVASLNAENVDVLTWTDSITGLNLIELILPVVGFEDNAMVMLAGKQTDFMNSDFDHMVITFKKTDVSYFHDTIPYGVTSTEMYGMHATWTTTGTINIHDSLVVSISVDSSHNTYLSGAERAPVLPTKSCVTASYNAIVEDEGGPIAHYIKDLLSFGILEGADLASAFLWCAFHSNSPWVAP